MSHPQRLFIDLLSAYLAETVRIRSDWGESNWGDPTPWGGNLLVRGQTIFQGEFPLDCQIGCLLVDTGGSRKLGLTTIQAVAGGTDYDAARWLAWDVLEAVEDLIPDPPAIPQRILGQAPDFVKVLRAEAAAEPAYLGKDASGRFLWSVNFLFTLGQKPRK